MFIDEDLKLVENIYLASFPEEERRPWNDLCARLHSGKIHLEVVRGSDGNIVGFATVWRFQDFAYIEHLAFDGNMRGLGLGGRLLDSIVEREAVPVVVEVELATAGKDAMRRIAFYERHGFAGHPDFGYMQPPYAPGLPPVPLMLMTSKPVDENLLKLIASTLHSRVYGKVS